MKEKHYDFCVVGAGVIGSATAKHLAKNYPGKSVLLIGPAEVLDRSSTDIFGAWYDEGRITRPLDEDEIWALLSNRAISKYPEIQQESGISFFHPVGYLSIGHEDGQFNNAVRDVANMYNSKYTSLKQPSLSGRFPYFNFQRDEEGVYSNDGSGYLNPRRMIAAQLQIARKFHCDVITDVVDSINPIGGSGHVISTHTGQRFTSDKVVMATGCFTHCRDLLPRGVVPKLTNMPETVILVGVNEDEQRRLAGMPCMVVRGDEGPNGPPNIESYILPPIKYPDGKYYLKVGHGRAVPIKLETPSELRDWYRRKEVGLMENRMLNMARRYFPGLSFSNYKFDHCVTSHTTSGYPYISMVTPSLGVAIGGCGRAAKIADELGLIAARMLGEQSWSYDIPESKFKFVSQVKNTKSKL